MSRLMNLLCTLVSLTMFLGMTTQVLAGPTPHGDPTPTATPTAEPTPTATPTATVTPTAEPTAKPTPTAEPSCTDQWGLDKITTIGKGQSPTNNPKIAMTISGHIVDPNSLKSNAHRIPVCEGTLVTIAVSDSTGTPTITAGGSLTCKGQLCTVTPVVTEKFKVVSSDGKDTDRMTLLPK